MRVLLLNQAFYPDVVSTAQYLTDVASELAARGHEVVVLTGRTGYDDPQRRFPAREVWRGIEVVRIGALRLGKTTRWRRALDFGSYVINCAWHLLRLRRCDVVVALTSPPLISTLGALYARLWRARSVFWVMDLNPDEAIAAGWLRHGSSTARILEWLLRFSLRRSDAVIVLDRFMRDRLIAKGTDVDRIVTAPPWSHDDDVNFNEEGRASFRRSYGLEGKFVVMYAGNHSPCNPLDTLMHVAERLRSDDRVVFFFVGGGSQFKVIQEFIAARRLQNARCLPYRPRHELSEMLSAADLHCVTLGDQYVGILHPCKIYNVLRVGIPALYIGPSVSHICDMAESLPYGTIEGVRHGDIDGACEVIRRRANLPHQPTGALASGFTRSEGMPLVIRTVENGNAVDTGLSGHKQAVHL